MKLGSAESNGGGLMSGSSNSSGTMNIFSFQEEPACAKLCPNLTYTQRIIGFGACCGFGMLLSLMGSLVLIGGFTDTNIQAFVSLYIVGNVMALCSTGFLIGPKSQCIKMWDPTRRYTTAFYLSMLIIVFAVAVSGQNIFLILALLFIEFLAAIWYSASYIPFARDMIKKCLGIDKCIAAMSGGAGAGAA